MFRILEALWTKFCFTVGLMKIKIETQTFGPMTEEEIEETRISYERSGIIPDPDVIPPRDDG